MLNKFALLLYTLHESNLYHTLGYYNGFAKKICKVINIRALIIIYIIAQSEIVNSESLLTVESSSYINVSQFLCYLKKNWLYVVI